MTMRDKIAGIIEDIDQDDGGAVEMADAIIAALPDMVPELVWVDSYGVLQSPAPFGRYTITGKILTLPGTMRPQMICNDLTEAKAAANAHYRAAIMKGLGL